MYIDNYIIRKYFIRKPCRNYKFFTPLLFIEEGNSEIIFADNDTKNDENIMIIDTCDATITVKDDTPKSKTTKIDFFFI